MNGNSQSSNNVQAAPDQVMDAARYLVDLENDSSETHLSQGLRECIAAYVAKGKLNGDIVGDLLIDIYNEVEGAAERHVREYMMAGKEDADVEAALEDASLGM